MTTKISQSRQWLERAAGQQLDALEDALAAFREDDAHSRHALHRQLQRIEAAARKAGFTGAAAMARQANTAGSANVRPFCNALTALQDEQISEPFESEAGWHIIQRLGSREQDVTEESRRNAARESIGRRKADEEYDRFLRQLRDEAYIDNRLSSS